MLTRTFDEWDGKISLNSCTRKDVIFRANCERKRQIESCSKPDLKKKWLMSGRYTNDWQATRHLW